MDEEFWRELEQELFSNQRYQKRDCYKLFDEVKEKCLAQETKNKGKVK